MSKRILSIAIGPVQQFIAVARRTRDLWFGSYMLSEVSKAMACYLTNQQGVSLIFPAPSVPKDLYPGSEFNVANKIIAEVSEQIDIEELVKEVQKKGNERWLDFAKETFDLAQGSIRKDIWDEQIGDVLEFYAAWAPLDNSYADTRVRVERILAGRKMLRDFVPAKGRAGVPKSSLDGSRESVLGDPDKMGKQARSKARLKKNEQLDAVGLVKRLGEDPGQFVSVTRVAVDPWVRKVVKKNEARDLLYEIRDKCHPDFANHIKDKTFEDFPKEGSVLLPSRLEALLIDDEMAEHRDTLKEIAKKLETLISMAKKMGIGEPSPYFAVLVADGDRMGQAISNLNSPEMHQKFSKQLSQFPVQARDIIRNHHGCLVYSGGDDVLAFLPLDTCLSAARELHDKFSEIMKKCSGNGEQEMTLSVGIGIGHSFEPLENLLHLGHDAERAAKGEEVSNSRNGLGVYLQTRSGDTVALRHQWTENPDKRLGQWTKMLETGDIPNVLPYDLYEVYQDYNYVGWREVPVDLLNKDIRRLLKKKRSRGQKLSEDAIEKVALNVNSLKDLISIAEELMIARHLAGFFPDV